MKTPSEMNLLLIDAYEGLYLHGAGRAFCIFWTSSITGKTGEGAVAYTFEECERICSESNVKFPGIVHEPRWMKIEKPLAESAAGGNV